MNGIRNLLDRVKNKFIQMKKLSGDKQLIYGLSLNCRNGEARTQVSTELINIRSHANLILD
jgi:hypothetical protein